MEGDVVNSADSFEEALNRLEQIVHAMEDAALPLQQMLVLFEEGTALGKRCQELLDLAELRIQQVTQGADGAVRISPIGIAPGAGEVDPAF